VSPSGKFNTDAASEEIILRDRQDDLLLVLEPDSIVSSTTITDTMGCLRRSILRRRIGSEVFSSQAPILGNFRHDLFEKALLQRNFDPNYLERLAEEVAWSRPKDLIAGGLTEEEALKDLLESVPFINKVKPAERAKRGVRTPTGGAWDPSNTPT